MKHIVAILAINFYLINGLCAQPTVKPPVPLLPVPTPEQLAWHEMEMNAFVHFSINTFTNKEWGMGNEDPKLFNPSAFDASQWTSALKDAGFKGLILTAKHHDGFCLWPSQFTKHSVRHSPFKGGNGDIVGEVKAACSKDGLKFGIYVSPWDRNHAEYGRPEYVEYYRKQLKELFLNYGPLFEMWFDGANGGDGYYGGANEIRRINGRTYYDWPGTINMVNQLQAGVIFFSDAGPGVRWVGNERGIAGTTNWNTITTDTLFAGKAGIEQLLNTGSPDGKHWVPAEVDVSIRPGWFFHAEENARVKSPEELFAIYLSSVGRGSTLLLNIPPDRRGLFHEKDLASLKGFREILDRELGKNLAKNAKITSEHSRGGSKKFAVTNLTDGNKDSYWATDDEVLEGNFTIELGKAVPVKYVLLQEYIQLGQRVKSFSIEIWENEKWSLVHEGTTIGYKTIVLLDKKATNKIRVNILGSKACLVLSNVEVY